ncbi:MAG: OmpH family outer membrane protein, partial [Rikenellaceae bacterium]
MTKKLLTLLTFVSLMFVGCKEAAKTTEATAEKATTDTSVAPSQTNIVYINSDSLVRGYSLFIDLKKKFDEKAAKIQGELETKSRSLERKVGDYQNKVQKGLITRAQAAEMEQSLAGEQQTVLQYRDKV